MTVMYCKMSQLTLLTLFCVLSCVTAYFIHVDANSEECFYEEATQGTRMTLTFEVAEGGFLDIDVNVSCVYAYAVVFITSCSKPYTYIYSPLTLSQ